MGECKDLVIAMMRNSSTTSGNGMTFLKHTIQLFITISAFTTLIGCGGSSSSDASTVADISLLPDGKIGSPGDLVNKAEYEAIGCGMTKNEVMAIVVDMPTKITGETLVWNNGIGTVTTSFTGVAFAGFVTTKSLSSATNSASPTIIRC
jgi:hypothetical protein